MRRLAALLVLAAPLVAQAPPEVSRVTGSVEVALQNLDVVVTDSSGNPVHGLAAADFDVRHDGKRARITNFHEEEPAPGAPPPAATGAPAPDAPAPGATPPAGPAAPQVEGARPPRHVVLFIDRLALPDPADRRTLFAALGELLQKGMGPGDDAMVVTWSRTIRSVHPFTGDQQTLQRALAAASGGAVRVDEEAAEIDRLAADDAWFQQTGVGDSTLSREMDASQAYQEVKAKVAALRALVATMAGMEGRKALVVVARRLSRRAGVEFGTGGIDTRSLIDAVSADANAAGVTLHTIYSAATELDLPSAATSRNLNPAFGGPRVSGRSQVVWNNEMASLEPLAERTGGVAAGGVLDAPRFARQVARDLGSWYSIGYPVPDGAARSADVSVTVSRPGATVRVRRSVVAKPADEQLKDRVLANLFRADEQAHLPIAVSVRPPRLSGRRTVRPVEVRVPVERLLLRPSGTGREGMVSFFAVSVSPDGTFSEVVRTRKRIVVPPAPPGGAPPPAVVEADVETRGPAARVSIALWDELGLESGFRLLVLR